MEKVWGEMWDAGGQWKKVSGKEIKRTEGGEGMTHTGPVVCMRVPICVCVCLVYTVTHTQARRYDVIRAGSSLTAFQSVHRGDEEASNTWKRGRVGATSVLEALCTPSRPFRPIWPLVV